MEHIEPHWTDKFLTTHEAERALRDAGISVDTHTWDADTMQRAGDVLDAASWRKHIAKQGTQHD